MYTSAPTSNVNIQKFTGMLNKKLSSHGFVNEAPRDTCSGLPHARKRYRLVLKPLIFSSILVPTTDVVYKATIAAPTATAATR